MYYSAYDDARLGEIGAVLHSAAAPAWCIFDNTAFGAAVPNALAMAALTG
jgi:uncharacterized protein YecE (DUF72 family)